VTGLLSQRMQKKRKALSRRWQKVALPGCIVSGCTAPCRRERKGKQNIIMVSLVIFARYRIKSVEVFKISSYNYGHIVGTYMKDRHASLSP